MTYTRGHGTRDCTGMSTNANGNEREYIILCSWANSQVGNGFVEDDWEVSIH